MVYKPLVIGCAVFAAATTCLPQIRAIAHEDAGAATPSDRPTEVPQDTPVSAVAFSEEDGPLAPAESILLTGTGGEIIRHSNLSDLGQASGLVFVGDVLSAEARDRGHGVAVTDYRFRVDDVVQGGSPGPDLVLTSLGGELPDGRLMEATGSLKLTPGQGYLVFLKPGGESLVLPFLRVFQVHENGNVVTDESGRRLVDLSPDGTMRFRKMPDWASLSYGTAPSHVEVVEAPPPEFGEGVRPATSPTSPPPDRVVTLASLLTYVRTGTLGDLPPLSGDSPTPASPGGSPRASAVVGAVGGEAQPREPRPDQQRWHVCGFVTGHYNFYCYIPSDANWETFAHCRGAYNSLVADNPDPTKDNDYLLGYKINLSDGQPIRDHADPSPDNGDSELAVFTSIQMEANGYPAWESLGNPNGYAQWWYVAGECTRIVEADVFVNAAIAADQDIVHKSLTKLFGFALSLREVDDRYSIMYPGLASQHVTHYGSWWYNRMDDCAGVRYILEWVNQDFGQTYWVLAPWADMAVYAQTHDNWGAEGNLVMADVSSDLVEAGESLTIEHFQVENRGNLAAHDVELGVYLSTDTTIKTSDRRIGLLWWSDPFPAHGKWSEASITVNIPHDVDAGTYYIGWIFETSSDERSYANNTALLVHDAASGYTPRSIQITPGPCEPGIRLEPTSLRVNRADLRRRTGGRGAPSARENKPDNASEIRKSYTIAPAGRANWNDLVVLERERVTATAPRVSPWLSPPTGAALDAQFPEHARALRERASVVDSRPKSERTEDAAGPARSSRVELGLNFEALPDNGVWIPPDTMGAIGPQHAITMLNSQVRIQGKSDGTVVVPDVSLQTFWAPSGAADVFDPRIVYDQGAGRWLATADADRQSAQSGVLFAISDTSDPTDDWTFYNIDADPNDIVWADFPDIGFNDTWVAITNNMFTNVGDNFDGAGLWVIDKASVLDGGAISFSRFAPGFDLSGGFSGSAMRVCTTFGNEPTLYLIDSTGFTVGDVQLLRLSQITGTAGSPNWGVTPGSAFPDSGAFPVDSNFSRSLLDAAQFDTNCRIETNDARMLNACFRNGHVWCTQSGALPVDVPDRTVVLWYRIDPALLGGNPIVQSGVIDGGVDVHHFFPSLAVNANNAMVIGFSRSDATRHVEAVVTGRLADDAAGVVDPITIVKAGESTYCKTFGGSRVRWGDYSAVVVDPSDDVTFWTIQEYAAMRVGPDDDDARWGTWWASIPGGSAFRVFNDSSRVLSVTSITAENSSPWLSISPSPPYAIPAGGEQVVQVLVDSTGLDEGWYHDRLLVNHDDPCVESPYPNAVYITLAVGGISEQGDLTQYDSTWTCGNGNWSQEFCWDQLGDGDSYPDNDADSTYNVRLPSGTYTVTLAPAGDTQVTINELTLESGPTLSVASGKTLSVLQDVSLAMETHLTVQNAATLDSATSLTLNSTWLQVGSARGEESPEQRAGAWLTLGGSFSYNMTDPARFAWAADARLKLYGGAGIDDANVAGYVSLEVAGEDKGDNPVTHAGDPAGFVNNFQVPHLVIGPDAHVQLVDDLDNGNRGGIGGQAEALYVNTLEFEDPAGRLVLNGLHLYYGTLIGTADQIRLTGDCNSNGIVDACDLACGPPGGACDVPGCGQAEDCNNNDIPDECDIADCPPGQQACDDCNANGTPDGCETATEITATYTGATPGSYNVPGNWDIVVVPANECRNLYNVIIPQSKTVNFDRPVYTELTGFYLPANSTLDLDTGEKLNVYGIAVQGGKVDASGAGTEFRAQSEYSSFQDNAQAWASGGALYAFGLPHAGSLSYRWSRTDLGGTTLFSANGTGSLLDLSSLGSINCPGYGSGVQYYTLMSSNSGTIDLSGLTNISGVPNNQDDYLRFRVESGGEIVLSALTTVTNRVFFDPEVLVFSLPALLSASGWFQVEPNCTISCPALTTLDSTTLEIKDQGTFDAPNLVTFTNSSVSLNPTRTLTVPPFTSINNSRMSVSDGALLAVAASSYAWTNMNWGDTILFSANGAGSLLDLGSLTSINSPGYINDYWGPKYYTFVSSNSGTVNLSGVTTISGVPNVNKDYLRFQVQSGGSMNLSALTTTSNRVYFDPEVPVFSLPSLQTASGAWFQVSVFNEINLPVLTALTNGTLDIQDGGTVNAPVLTTFTNSSVSLNATRFLNAPRFTAIDNARISVSGGAQYAVAAPTYAWTNIGWDSTTLFSADGQGSRLDLSSLGSINAPGYWNLYWEVYTISVSNGAVIDLSHVTTVSGSPTSDNDWLCFQALTGGELIFGNVAFQQNRTILQGDGSASRIAVSGSIGINSPAQLKLTNAATLAIGGNFTFNHTAESDFDTSFGVVHLDGSGTQTFEVGGQDVGVPSGSLPSNFTWGKMIVGDYGSPTVVRLVDLVNNGNRGPQGQPEALYIQGFAQGEDSLRIRGGATLALGGVNVYAIVNNEWTHLNDLIPPGQTIAPYDEGYITRSVVVHDCNANGIDDAVDIIVGTSEDCNNNTVPDECDLDPTDPDGNGQVSPDANGNGTPDECEDCNANGTADYLDIQGGVSPDCNANLVPDECEAGTGGCNNNGVADSCELAPGAHGLVGTYYDNNNFTGLMRGRIDETIDFNWGTGAPWPGFGVDTFSIRWKGYVLSTTGGTYTFYTYTSDGVKLWVKDLTTPIINKWQNQSATEWSGTVSLSANTLYPIIMEYYENTSDALARLSWMPPGGTKVVIPSTNLFPGQDCNANNVPDYCDIAAGTSSDVNNNGFPDGCEADCNQNGIPDAWEIQQNPTLDCQPNGVLDECDVDPGDPDGNGQVSMDRNGNGAPDECETDCNGNGIPDSWDVSQGTSQDCQPNTTPDECDLALANLEQYAGTVLGYSSQRGSTNYAATQALGAPNTSNYGEYVTAWSPANKNGTLEFITVGFPTPALSTGVTIWETNGNGFVYQIDVVDTNNAYHTVWSGIDPSQPGAVVQYSVTWPQTDYRVKGVKIYVDTNHNLSTYEQIDAVKLYGRVAPSWDLDGNGVPDECDPDCNQNGTPDAWDIAHGTPDCNNNDIPDSCDINPSDPDGNGQVSPDTNGNGIPDECEDCNGNGVLDYLDLAAGTSEDCNANMVPDECETLTVYQWIGPNNGAFTTPTYWSPAGVPGGRAVLTNTTAVDNTCVLSGVAEKTVCEVTLGATGNGKQTLRINAGSTLKSTGGTTVNTGGQVNLVGGTLDDGDVVVAAHATRPGRVYGSGTIAAPVVNAGLIEALGGELALTGEAFTNQTAGTLRATAGRLVDVQAGTVTQAGLLEVRSSGTMLFAGPLGNQGGGRISLLGGTLGAPELVNSNGADLSGFGTLEAPWYNAGTATFIADSQVVGDVINESTGTITIQNGTLTIVGNLTNDGTILGDVGKWADPKLPKRAADGIFVEQDYVAGAGSKLLMPSANAVVQVGGDFAVAINSNGNYDMAEATLHMTGQGASQTLELMCRDVGLCGSGLVRNLPGHYPIGTLRIGLGPATVVLVDEYDNDAQGQTAREALYVRTLRIDPGATLNNAGILIYYEVLVNEGTVTHPENLVRIVTPGDMDDDGDVDLTDYTGFPGCLTGHGGGPLVTACRPADLDCDDDVDLTDFAAFQAVFTGP